MIGDIGSLCESLFPGCWSPIFSDVKLVDMKKRMGVVYLVEIEYLENEWKGERKWVSPRKVAWYDMKALKMGFQLNMFN